MPEQPKPDVAKKQRARKLVRGLARTYGDVECALVHDSAFQLLVATILSAQCTDERVNATTPHLFERFPTAVDLSKSTQRQIEKIVHPLGFFRAKASNIRRMASQLVEQHEGEVPSDLDALVQLAGVGRKTANVVLGTVFGIASGVVVDTHVKRISRLFGLTESSNPEVIERDLAAILPTKEWIMYSHRVIHHGRRICIARRPKCQECPLIKNCLRVGLPALE